VVLPASEFVGVNVAVVSSLLKLTEPPAAFPAESLSVNDTVLGTTGWENVTVGVAVTGLPADPESGVEPVTVGAGSALVNTTSIQ
jgi:hypothetical protein